MTNLFNLEPKVQATLTKLRSEKVLARIWEHDHTVWKEEPTEISNRLGWLHSPEVMRKAVPEITAFVEEIRSEGFTHALLLGMGGSSLAPEVFYKTFGVKPGHLDLAVLDSTSPGAVLAFDRQLDPRKTLFIVSTKSGGTVETFSFFKYFYNRVVAQVGTERAGQQFVAITDPDSGLVETASKHGFRKTFLNDPNIGGRYSALSYFGLVPAALIGVDISKLLQRAAEMAFARDERGQPAEGDNTGVWLGAIMAEATLNGRDKLTFILSRPIASFGAWVEQLIAESTGKEGTGILPVVTEPVGAPAVYAEDRLFVHLQESGDTTHDQTVAALQEAGQPVISLQWRDQYDLGGEFFRWEIATAIAGWRLRINPFDQPDVEAAKVLARKAVSEYHERGSLPKLRPTLQADGITVYSSNGGHSLRDTWQHFLAQAQEESGKPGGRSYIALHAYVKPKPATEEALTFLATRLRDRFGLASTYGYGPRFLHSTGQLHKGDAGKGLFVQITEAVPEDTGIPDAAGAEESTMSFGVLIMAQAHGDRQALLANRRKVIRFDFGKDVTGGLRRLAELV